MRIALFILLIAASTPVAAEPMNKEACRRMAEGIETVSASIRTMLDADRMSRTLDLSGRSSGPLFSASEKAVEATNKVNAEQRKLLVAYEDFSYQLRICAR